jgi:hypothetical protein
MRANASKSGSWWWTAQVAALFTLIATAVWIGLLWRQQIALREMGQDVRSELARLDSIEGAPSDEEFERARLNRDRLLATFSKARPVEPGAPADPRELYFTIARFVEDTRAAARAARIDLRARERFGFSAYAEQPPEPHLLRAVARQLAGIRRIMAALVAAHPRALHAVRRTAQSPAPTEAAATAEDFFVPAGEPTLRAAGASPPDAFLVEFTGDTAALRRFLHSLAEGEGTAVVRSVSAAAHPPTREQSITVGRDQNGGAIAGGLSRFAVTVEVLENSKPAEEEP